MENRKKKAQVKKIIKKKKEEDMDNLIKEDLMKKKFEASEKNKLQGDIDEMKNMMKNLVEENKRLKSAKPTLKTIDEDTQSNTDLENDKQSNDKQIQEIKPLKIHRSKGITSRWSKYNR